MTHRAFSALRVIRWQGKFTSRVAQDFLCISIRKMNITQNLWIRLTPDQFSGLPYVNTYPGMDSLCQSMRFRKSCSGAKIFFSTPKSWKSHKNRSFWKCNRKPLNGFRKPTGASGRSAVVWSTFECLEKHTKFNISAHKNGRNVTCSVQKILILRPFSEIMWKEFILSRTWGLGGRRLYESLARWTSVDGLPRANKSEEDG